VDYFIYEIRDKINLGYKFYFGDTPQIGDEWSPRCKGTRLKLTADLNAWSCTSVSRLSVYLSTSDSFDVAIVIVCTLDSSLGPRGYFFPLFHFNIILQSTSPIPVAARSVRFEAEIVGSKPA
jgi:hypothetical protein